MADCSKGPVATMRGATHLLPENGVCCDNHQDRPAVARIQGETDSFGCEYHDLCDECAEEMRQALAEEVAGICDWCRLPTTDLREYRDPEEGQAGPVYTVCQKCCKKHQGYLAAKEGSDQDEWDTGEDD